MELKIDPQSPRKNWEYFAAWLIPNDHVYFVVKYHAYMLNNIFNIKFVDNASTSGNAIKTGRRVYVYTTGKYINHDTLDCDWKIILKKEIGHTLWSMEKITQTNCTCMHPFTNIDFMTLINQLDFQLQVKNINGN